MVKKDSAHPFKRWGSSQELMEALEEQKKNATHAKPLIRKFIDAYSRIISKTVAFNTANIFTIKAQIAALKGNRELHQAKLRLEKALSFSNQDSSSYFTSILFVDLVSEVELFFCALAEAVVTEYPKKLGNIQFKLSEILDVSNEELISVAVEEQLYKLFYKKQNEYLDELCSLLAIDRAEVEPYWPAFVEAKARRDLGVHNNWICNKTYLRKLREAHIETSASEGDSLLPGDKYVINVNEQIGFLASVIAFNFDLKYGEAR